MRYIIDMRFGDNLTAQEIPSAVGMRGLHIHGHGDYDFPKYAWDGMLRSGQLREASRFDAYEELHKKYGLTLVD